MKNWKKVSLITAVILLALLIGLFYIFNLRISTTSSDIAFLPGKDITKDAMEYTGEKPKNIIVFVADGMGFGHLSLALHTQQSENAPSVWQEFDVKGWHDARSGYGPLTDSEASATAMFTGTSTSFGYIGLDKDGNTLKSVFDVASDQQYTSGIVTDSYIWDGTPAAFVAHTKNEDDARDIMTQMASSRLDLLFGELEDLGEDGVPEKEETLNILRKRFQLLDTSLALPENPLKPVAVVFDEDEIQDLDSSPNLPKLTEVALKYLTSRDKPFILLVESEEMDAASHNNDSDRVLKGLKVIQQTLSLVLDFSKKKGETLVIFTADHETGGLAAVADFEKYPNMQIRWSTKDHSAAVVPLFASGPSAEYFADIHRNREIGVRLKKLISQNTEPAELQK